MGILTALPFVILVLWIAPVFPLLYVLIRWRSGGEAEPGLGSFSLVLYFRCAAILVAVAALATLTYLGISDKKGNEEVQRVAWGVLTASIVFLAVHMPLGSMLRPHGDATSAIRTFSGFILALSGMIVYACMLLLFVTLFEDVEGEFAEKNHTDMLKLSGTWLGWYGALYGLTAKSMS